MDRPVLHPPVRQLAESERFRQFLEEVPDPRARVSEPALARPRPAPIRVAPGEEAGIDALAERLALAGYERVEQAQERGQFALRGGIVDVYPATGREPFRIEFFGDQIESIRAFSPFTQRTLHPV